VTGSRTAALSTEHYISLSGLFTNFEHGLVRMSPSHRWPWVGTTQAVGQRVTPLVRMKAAISASRSWWGMTCPFSRDNSEHGALLCCAFVQYSDLAPLHQVTSYIYMILNYLCVNFLMSRPLDARAETSNAALFYVTRMTDKRMKVSLCIAFAMSRFPNVKALYEGTWSK
jgi:hypothetical protein